jgi:hypothetical protein
MAASKRFLNWTNVSFVPMGGTSVPITGVSSIMIDTGGNLLKFSGDGDRYNTIVVNDFNEPTVTIQAADLSSICSYPVGTVGTFSATHNDARNGTGTGAVTYTLSNAVIASNSVRGVHRQFGQGTLVLTSYSSDGTTNPLSTSIAQ